MHNDYPVALDPPAHCWVPLGSWEIQFENQRSKELLLEHQSTVVHMAPRK